MTRAAVLGSGSWGTTFAKVLADAGTDVVLWARRPELAATIRETSENPDYLPGVRLPDRLTATADARGGGRPAPTSSCSRSRRRACATTSRPWRPRCRRASCSSAS